jgi:hypothetical protein
MSNNGITIVAFERNHSLAQRGSSYTGWNGGKNNSGREEFQTLL